VKWWRWNKGRQGTGYDVLPFFISKLLLADCYLIRIGKGVSVPEHVDPAKPGFAHHRFNVHFGRFKGGELKNEKVTWAWKNVYLFRPDLSKHSVSEVTDGTLYVFSFGFLARSDNPKLAV
jgi:hypothetical protein